MGHGCSYGLFAREGMNFTKPIKGFGGLLVNENWVDMLRKKEVIGIWCYAADFAIRHKLKGFYTGMFISEQIEADYLGIKSLSEEISLSNELFSNVLRFHIFSDQMSQSLRDNYVGNSDIIRFNRSQMGL